MSSSPGLSYSFELEGRKVGVGHPVFVIAEIGVNHNGDPEIAKKMIDSAAECGADCVKFQTFRTEEFMADRKMEYEYDLGGSKVRENMFDMFKRLELPLEAYGEIFAHCRRRGVVPLTSVADSISAEMMLKVGISGFKLASEDLINLPLVEYVCALGLPVIFSTGMGNEEEVLDALGILRNSGNTLAIFLHCVSIYPTPDEQANLLRIKGLEKLTGYPVGYSDHTEGIEACLGAVALGATVIEKHFTLGKNMSGPDHAFSADPTEFRALVQSIRKIEKQLGDGVVRPAPMESESRVKFRRSIVACRDLPVGHSIQNEDLQLKRPSVGLRAREMDKVCGKTLIRPIKRDEPILLSDVKPGI